VERRLHTNDDIDLDEWGGWRLDTLSQRFNTRRCTIAVRDVSEISEEDFLKDFVDKGKPVRLSLGCSSTFLLTLSSAGVVPRKSDTRLAS